MKFLPILLCFGYVVSFPGYNPNNQGTYPQGHSHGHQHGHSHNDFLSGLSQKAVSEYFKISQDTKQTIMQMERALQSWARKYGVEDKYNAHMEEHKKEQKLFKKSIKAMMPKLTEFFKKYIKIGDDKRQSLDTLFRKTQQLFSKLDHKQQAVASFAIQTYSSSMEGDGGCQTCPEDNGGFPKDNGGPFGGNGGSWNGGYSGGSGGFPGGYGAPFGGSSGGSWSGGFSGGNGGFPGSYGNSFGSGDPWNSGFSRSDKGFAKK